MVRLQAGAYSLWRWREDPSDLFEDLRQRFNRAERDQTILLSEIREAQAKLAQLHLQIERDARERRVLTAAILLLLVVLLVLMLR